MFDFALAGSRVARHSYTDPPNRSGCSLIVDSTGAVSGGRLRPVSLLFVRREAFVKQWAEYAATT